MGDSRKTTQEHSLPSGALWPERLLELCPLGLMLSHDRRVSWCNVRFADLFGYRVDELVGNSLVMLYASPVEFERIGDRGLKVMRECGEYRDERLMRRRDGRLQWFRVHGRASDRADPFVEAAWVFEPLAAGVDTDKLSPREREVLAGMTRGLTAKVSARELGISPRTVEKVRAGLRERYGARNAAELVGRVGGLPV